MSSNEIGRRLKSARLNAKLTQAEAAQKLGITYQAISNYERGINRVDTDTLRSLCKIYGVRLTDLLCTDGAEETPTYAQSQGESGYSDLSHSPLSEEDQALLFAYHHASEEDRQIMDFIVKRYTPTKGEQTG